MKIAAIIVRILMGLLFIFGAVAFFLSPPPQLPDGNMKTYFEGLAASGYFFTVIESYGISLRNCVGRRAICVRWH